MGNLRGAASSDDAVLRRVGEQAAVDYLCALLPDLKGTLADQYLRGQPMRRLWTDDGEPPPDSSEPGPANAPGPGSLIS
jgi:hypothetical protein